MLDVKISKHMKNGRHVGWRKFVGGKVFHLSTGTEEVSELRAKRIARALVNKWKLITAVRGTWTEAAVAECFGNTSSDATAVKEVITAAPPTSEIGTATSQVTTGFLLYDVIETYKEWQRERYEANEIGEDQFLSILQRIEKAKDAMPNQPLNCIDDEKLTKFRQYFTARPTTILGTPMAVSYVVNIVREMKTFFGWCRKRAGWQASADWQDCFKFRAKKLRTLLEKRHKAKGFANFTVSDLQILWHLSTDWFRLMIGLGFFCGFTQKEIGTLLVVDVIERDGEMFIDRLRGKTEVEGYWWLATARYAITVSGTWKLMNPRTRFFVAKFRPTRWKKLFWTYCIKL